MGLSGKTIRITDVIASWNMSETGVGNACHVNVNKDLALCHIPSDIYKTGIAWMAVGSPVDAPEEKSLPVAVRCHDMSLSMQDMEDHNMVSSSCHLLSGNEFMAARPESILRESQRTSGLTTLGDERGRVHVDPLHYGGGRRRFHPSPPSPPPPPTSPAPEPAGFCPDICSSQDDCQVGDDYAAIYNMPDWDRVCYHACSVYSWCGATPQHFAGGVNCCGCAPAGTDFSLGSAAYDGECSDLPPAPPDPTGHCPDVCSSDLECQVSDDYAANYNMQERSKVCYHACSEMGWCGATPEHFAGGISCCSCAPPGTDFSWGSTGYDGECSDSPPSSHAELISAALV